MATRLVQNINNHNMRPQLFKNMLSKNKKHSSTYYDSILPTITNDYNIFELQGFLKHDDFVGKSTIKF
jgi:hypothetical protein